MDSASFLILAYSSFANKIEGRTKLQKMIYFLSLLMKKEKELEYTAHYYGPYSPVITNTNSHLKSLKYLSEIQKDIAAFNSEGFEVKRYDYKLTNDGMKMADSLKKQFPNEWNEISRNAENIKKAGKLDYMELAVASKVYYILSQETADIASKEKIYNIAHKFGWEVAKPEIEKASKFLTNLELIKVEK